MRVGAQLIWHGLLAVEAGGQLLGRDEVRPVFLLCILFVHDSPSLIFSVHHSPFFVLSGFQDIVCKCEESLADGGIRRVFDDGHAAFFGLADRIAARDIREDGQLM